MECVRELRRDGSERPLSEPCERSRNGESEGGPRGRVKLEEDGEIPRVRCRGRKAPVADDAWQG